MMKIICYGSVIASLILTAGCIVGNDDNESTGGLGYQLPPEFSIISTSHAGAPCAYDSDCGNGVCLNEANGAIGGYCSQVCSEGYVESTCGFGVSMISGNGRDYCVFAPGTTFTGLGGSTVCLQTCEIGRIGCREGYACTHTILGGPDQTSTTCQP